MLDFLRFGRQLEALGSIHMQCNFLADVYYIFMLHICLSVFFFVREKNQRSNTCCLPAHTLTGIGIWNCLNQDTNSSKMTIREGEDVDEYFFEKDWIGSKVLEIPQSLTSANLGPAIDRYVMVYSAIVP